ncbi:hypothetical protein HUB94_08045 [Paenibacillus cellulosilyticus]|nr:hypothetical protein [Paenibacillus cellulosilyticus]QKS44371.1 hypothetical protein HUB94_08045 [Paenibacillus cellulosilyticus]
MSIILRQPASLEWIYSHYIQLELLQGLSGVDYLINYTFPDAPEAVCPWLEVRHVPRTSIEGNIVPWLQERLMEGYYIYLFLNTYHLPSYSSYHESDYAHDPLIVGFDSSAHTFAIRDFHSNPKGYFKYETFNVDFASLERSYNTMSEDMDKLGGVQLLRVNANCTYQFDSKLAANSIADYLESRCSYPKVRNWLTTPVFSYGLQLYAHLSEHFRSVAEGKASPDFRLLHVFHDHKLLMRHRLHFMAYQKHLIPEHLAVNYDQVLTTSLRLRSIALKYYLTRDTKYLHKCDPLLSDLQNKEHQTLLAIIDALRS